MTHPSPAPTHRQKFRRAFLLILTFVVSAIFLLMIRPLIMPLVLAAISSALAYPLYRRILALLRGKRGLASAVTILMVLLLVVIPLLLFLGVVAAEALSVSEKVGPWISEQVGQANEIDSWIDRLPFAESIRPYRGQIMAKLGELTARLGSFLFAALSATTLGTISFFFNLSIMLYSMFFFLTDGPAILRKMFYYMPLAGQDKERMANTFVSVARAMIKGTFLIGIAQGALAGAAFQVVGIEGAVFWGTVMTVLSIIPAIGTPLVWVPAVVYMLAVGRYGAALGLAAWCGLVVGSVDNFLRPRLVGRDVGLPDLLIFVGTIGGIFFFGAVGFLLGPILAAVFVTVWDLYGVAFQDVLSDPARRRPRRRRNRRPRADSQRAAPKDKADAPRRRPGRNPDPGSAVS